MHVAFRKNMGCYIKLGQIISHMESILPEAYSRELEPLCQECPTIEIERIRKTLEKEFGKDPDLIFKEIDPVPLGSASLAQVHKAVLHDGTPVAIKVQHDHIADHVKGDIFTVKLGCYIAEMLFPDFKYKWLGDEFASNLPKELEFTREGKNADKLRELFKDDPKLVIPKVFWEYTTDKVLVMSFEEGKSITDQKYLKDNNINLPDLSAYICDVFNCQIFKHGFVHGDPHQGNLFVRKEKVNGKDVTRLVLLDHGLYLELDNDFRYYTALLWRGIFTQNREILIDASKKLGVKNYELFVSLLTKNVYSEVMDEEKKYATDDRLYSKKTEDEKTKMRKYAKEFHRDLTHILSGVRKEMLQLIKVNEFLRNIDTRIDGTLNYAEIMMKYIYSELEIFEQDKGKMHILGMRLEYYKYMLFFSGYKCYLYFFPGIQQPHDVEAKASEVVVPNVVLNEAAEDLSVKH
jgi:aarF domain-containing kinase